MDVVLLSAFIRPFMLLAVFVGVVIPVRIAIMHLMPEGKIKQILNKRIS